MTEQWYNEPPAWSVEGDKITITAGPKTDFWRRTRHDFVADNGNFYYREVSGNFTAEVKLSGQYESLYDQAGLMVRLNATTWMKCGIEYVESTRCASVVVTRDYSDWSLVPFGANPEPLWLRVTRIGSAIEVHYSLDGNDYTMLRQAYLTDVQTLQVGLMAASPQGDGFSATFEGFKVES